MMNCQKSKISFLRMVAVGCFVLLFSAGFGGYAGASAVTPMIALTGSPDDTLCATVQLDTGELAGQSADWWIVMYAPSGWYAYQYPDTWISSGTDAAGLQPVYQGPLFDLTDPVEILCLSGLDNGAHYLFFGVDMTMDGRLDAGVAYDWAAFEVNDDDDSGLVINEVVAKAADGGEDWIEFYVSGTASINLSNYSVVDDKEDREPAALPNVTLAPGDFYVVLATDEAPNDDAVFVPFKLGADDCVKLFSGDALIDQLDWEDGDALAGYSYGRWPDGAENAQTLSPTQGYNNEPFNFFLEDTVEDVYITISETDWNSILSSPLDEEYHTASITYRNSTLEDVAFRTKGNSSLRAVADMNSERYSFKVDMNYYVDGQKLLGMKKINLNNNYKDPSYMRERIAYDMMRSLDIPAPRLSYVNLYINGSLHGLYTLVEQVDSEFLEANFDNPDGDLYKPDGTGSDLLWRGDSFASYAGVELKTNEETSDNAAFINMVNELNDGSDLESVIDVDGFLRYLAVSTALSNLDSYQGELAHNYYIYEQDGVFSLIPWDLNESFGSFTMGCQDSNAMITFYIDEPTSGALAERPLIAKLLDYEDYKTAYHGYIQNLVDGVMNPVSINAKIEETETLISAHVANDPTAFYSYSDFQTSLGYGMVENIFGLQGFVEDRTENLSAQLSGAQPSEGDGNGSCNNGNNRPPGRF